MKVAFLGNVNNHPFVVAHHFKEKDAEVHFYVDAERTESLNRPESTGFVDFPYPDWIKEVPQFRRSWVMFFPFIFARKIIREVNECDAVVLNNYAHLLIPYLRKDLIKICMFTGGDLDIMGDIDNVTKMRLSNPKLRMFPAFLKKTYAKFSVSQLHNAIRRADLIGYFPEGLNKKGDEILHRIFGNKSYNKYSHWCVMLDGLGYTAPPENPKPVVLNLARFIWKTPLPPGTAETENKRNDIMINGIGKFLKEHPGTLDIRFVDKGIHLAETKALIQQWGYAGDVTWLEVMPLNKLFDEIKKADIIFDQLGQHLIGAGIFAMALGRPVIAHARQEILRQQSGNEEIPVCDAWNEDMVYDWLKKLVFDKKLREDTGRRSSEFAFKYMDIRKESEYYFNFIAQQLASRQKK